VTAVVDQRRRDRLTAQVLTRPAATPEAASRLDHESDDGPPTRVAPTRYPISISAAAAAAAGELSRLLQRPST